MDCVFHEVKRFNAKGELLGVITREQLVERNLRSMHNIAEVLHNSVATPNALSDIKCAFCGKEVEALRHRKKYCSRDCSFKAASRRRGFNRTSFEPKAVKILIHKGACIQEHDMDRKCETCGARFVAAIMSQIHCRRACANKASRIRCRGRRG